jgi:hypothetical protein
VHDQRSQVTIPVLDVPLPHDAIVRYNVRKIIMAFLGAPPRSLPKSWENEVVFQFADGGNVVLLEGADTKNFEATLAQEKVRRSKANLSLDGFVRRRLKDDRLVVYIHPAPFRGRMRKQALQHGECDDGAGI